jgi:hypothetical protein
VRLVSVLSLTVVLLAASVPGRARAQSAEPFFAVGPSYPAFETAAGVRGPASTSDRERWLRELGAIKASGFNSIRMPVEWATTEPERGHYRLDRVGDLLTTAADAGLRVIIQVDARAGPAWLRRRYPDSAVVPEGRTAAAASASGYCMDHPGVRADLGTFIGAVAAASVRYPAFYAIDVWRSPGVSSNTAAKFCYCPHTEARFRDALQRRYGTLPALNAAWGRSFGAWAEVHVPRPRESGPQSDDWQQFVAVKLQEDLKFRSDASAPRGARPVTSHGDLAAGGAVDPWLMTSVVDHYGTSFAPPSGGPARVLAALDVLRSSGRDKVWWLGSMSPGSRSDAGATGATPARGGLLRLWAWAAISRGAAALSVDPWRVLAPATTTDGQSMSRARALADTAGVVARNSSLFAPLRPHPSSIAILWSLGNQAGSTTLNAWQALFDTNIQADFVHSGELATGTARYDVVYVPNSAGTTAATTAVLAAFAAGGGTLIIERSTEPSRQMLEDTFSGEAKPWTDDAVANARVPAGSGKRSTESGVQVANRGSGRVFLLAPLATTAPPEMARARKVLQRVVAAAGISPEVRIDVIGGLVEARFLESSNAVLLLALNYGSAPQKVTFTFAPDVPEAIWQNMETGAAVNFRQGPDGATYTRTLGGSDVMVLVRGKRLR